VIHLTKEEHNTLEVVPHVELKKYLGKWYEIAQPSRKISRRLH